MQVVGAQPGQHVVPVGIDENQHPDVGRGPEDRRRGGQRIVVPPEVEHRQIGRRRHGGGLPPPG